MESYKTPSGSNGNREKINDDGSPQQEQKLPEFVFVDENYKDENQLGSTPEDSKQIFGSIQSIAQGRHPFYLRVIAFFGTFAMIALSVVVLIVVLITSLLSILLLRQSQYMNEQAAISWRSFKKAMVFTLGCFVSIFNISMGVGIVLMYFLLTGEKVNSRFMQEFTKTKGT